MRNAALRGSEKIPGGVFLTSSRATREDREGDDNGSAPSNFPKFRRFSSELPAIQKLRHPTAGTMGFVRNLAKGANLKAPRRRVRQQCRTHPPAYWCDRRSGLVKAAGAR